MDQMHGKRLSVRLKPVGECSSETTSRRTTTVTKQPGPPEDSFNTDKHAFPWFFLRSYLLVSMPSEDDTITRVYGALANPIRRKIVDILKAKQKAGFKDLHESLIISVGTVYHHLEALEGIVAQDQEKKYLLTEHGKRALETLSESEEKISTREMPSLGNESRLSLLSKEILFGRSLFNYIRGYPIRTLPLAILVVLIGEWLSVQTNLEPLLLLYLNPSPGVGRIWSVVLFPAGWAATFALSDLFSIAIFKRRGGEISLLNSTAFALLPLLVVPAISFFVGPLSTNIRVQAYPIILLQIALQAWVVCLLSGAISISKGLRVERSATVSLAVVYLNIVAVVAALGLGIF